MDFINCQAIPQNRRVVEIVSAGTRWDLQKNLRFRLFDFQVMQQRLTLVWNHRLGHSERNSDEIRIQLHGVTSFAATARDCEPARIEDDCLDAIVFDENNDSLAFEFRGGMVLNVVCREFGFMAAPSVN